MLDFFNAAFLLLSETKWVQIGSRHRIPGMKAHVRPTCRCEVFGFAFACDPRIMRRRIAAALPSWSETHSLTVAVTESSPDGCKNAICHSQLGNGDSMHRSDGSAC